MSFEISLLSFVACILVASMLARSNAFAFLEKRNSLFETLDGLRGFLAISVFFHHFVITYYWKHNGKWTRPPEDIYQNYGKVGVALFFMITGFLFISKILDNNHKVNWLKLYESRIFRIFPLYIFAVVLITWIVFHNSGYRLNNTSLHDLANQYFSWSIFHGSSINGFPDTNLIIAGVDWTLKYEWLFYISLPVLSFALHKGGKTSAFLLIILTVAFFLYPIRIWSISTIFFVLFAVGGIVAYIAKHPIIPEQIIKSRVTSFVCILLFLGSIFYPHTLNAIHLSIVSLFFILVVLGNNIYGLLQLKSTKLLGEISYSIYLLHGIVLYIIFTQFELIHAMEMNITQFSLLMPIVSILVTLISSITYLTIERPFIQFGRQYFLTKWTTPLISDINKILMRTGR